MTYQNNSTLSPEILEEISEQGLEYLPELIRIIVNEAMKQERQKYLGVGPYQRDEERQGHANGFKNKTIRTRVGEIKFDIPQVREGGFYPESLEKGIRSERALNLTMAEMYIKGVSTRKVSAIMEKLCGTSVSASTVSEVAKQLDETLEKWRNSPLGEVKYMYLDARYEKIRQDGYIQDVGVLIAVGIDWSGHRKVLGVTIALGEQELHWRTFMESLVQRGLRGVELIISDDHVGLKAARKAVFGGVPWQRCQFHLQQNAQSYVPKKAMQAEVAEDLRSVFSAPNRIKAEENLQEIVQKYQKSASKLSHWMEENIPEGLTVFSFPAAHRKKIRTTNSIERLNREIKRRTKVVGVFPNENSCLRLVSAILIDISEKWETGWIFLDVSDGH
jgi:transposase-like protein